MEGVLKLCFRVQNQLVTQASQEVPHPTSGWAKVEFASEIGRDRMLFPLFGCYPLR